MVKMKLVLIINEILKALKEVGLSAGTLGLYRNYFDKMQNYFSIIGEKYYSETVLKSYWTSLNNRVKPYSRKYLSRLYRSIHLVKEYYAIGSIVWAHRKTGSDYTPCPFFQTLIIDSINRLQLVGSTLKWYDTIVRKFCCKLEKMNIFNLQKISNSIVLAIILNPYRK